MLPLLERISSGEILISDGAMGTFLHAQGLGAGECPESWCVTRPDVVRGIAEAYLEAGSDVIETNSFGANAFKLRSYGMAERAMEFNRAAAQIAKSAAQGRAYVAASIGPTGHIAEVEGGGTSEEALYNAFAEQAIALAEGGADALCIETMSSLIEARAAIRAAKDNTGLPVICTFTFELGARGFRTMMGLKPDRAAREAVAAGADVVGSNCGNGMQNLIAVAREMRSKAPAPVMIQANAGMPVLEGGRTLFTETPQDMAAKTAELIEAGAAIIGGCCGTTPEHIRAVALAARGITR